MSELSAKERVEVEVEELEDKLNNLRNFDNGDNIANISFLQKRLLNAQLYAMESYLSILVIRLDNWED